MSRPPDLPATGSRKAVLMAVLVVLALALGIGGIVAYLLSDRPTGQAGPAPSQTPIGAATTAGATTAAGTVAAAGEFRSVRAGQCLVNEGTDDEPAMHITACTPGTYEVLKRVDGTIDYESTCAAVPGYQFHFSYDSDLDSLDFVLCLRRR